MTDLDLRKHDVMNAFRRAGRRMMWLLCAMIAGCLFLFYVCWRRHFSMLFLVVGAVCGCLCVLFLLLHRRAAGRLLRQLEAEAVCGKLDALTESFHRGWNLGGGVVSDEYIFDFSFYYAGIVPVSELKRVWIYENRMMIFIIVPIKIQVYLCYEVPETRGGTISVSGRERDSVYTIPAKLKQAWPELIAEKP